MTTHHKEYKSRALLGEYRTPKMVLWLLKHSGGLLKTQRQAAYILFGFILFTIVAVPYIVMTATGVIQHPPVYAPGSGMVPGRDAGANAYPR